MIKRFNLAPPRRHLSHPFTPGKLAESSVVNEEKYLPPSTLSGLPTECSAMDDLIVGKRMPSSAVNPYPVNPVHLFTNWLTVCSCTSECAGTLTWDRHLLSTLSQLTSPAFVILTLPTLPTCSKF